MTIAVDWDVRNQTEQTKFISLKNTFISLKNATNFIQVDLGDRAADN